MSVGFCTLRLSVFAQRGVSVFAHSPHGSSSGGVIPISLYAWATAVSQNSAVSKDPSCAFFGEGLSLGFWSRSGLPSNSRHRLYSVFPDPMPALNRMYPADTSSSRILYIVVRCTPRSVIISLLCTSTHRLNTQSPPLCLYRAKLA